MLPLLLLVATADPAPAEFVIRNATVYDGTGSPGVKSAIHIRGDKIASVGKVEPGPNATVIDGTGLVVAPGFIDLHTHCDSNILGKTARPNMCYTTQGVTTVVTGNCGSGPVDTAKFYREIEAGGVGTNVIHQAPHNNIRSEVMGNVNRPPTADELKKMAALVDKAMDDGAFGLATGLIYNPGTYAKTDELAALAKAAAKHGGHYASHIRNEGGGLLDAIQEAITIGKSAGCPVHVSHIKASGRSAHGLSARAVGLIESARAAGVKVTADQYPYTASSTSLRATLMPAKYREGAQTDLVARLDDPVTGPKIRSDLESAIKERDGGKAIQIARYAPKPAWQGKRLSAIAADEKKEPVEIVLEIERAGGASVVNFAMNEEDVRVYMKQPWVATASDGSTQLPGGTVPHPRSYGTFARKVGRYAVEEKLVTLEAAIRSCSGLPADILRLTDRGYVKAGQFADVVVFDPAAFRDTATYDQPHQYATGVKYLFVNGKLAIDNGTHKSEVLAGRALKHAKQ